MVTSTMASYMTVAKVLLKKCAAKTHCVCALYSVALVFLSKCHSFYRCCTAL